MAKTLTNTDYKRNMACALERNNVSGLKSKRSKPNDSRMVRLVFIDLETSGLCERTNEVLQIAAVAEDLVNRENEDNTEDITQRSKTFNMYVTPTKEIEQSASSVNKIFFKDGMLYHRNEKVESFPLRVCLEKFLEFIDSLGEGTCIQNTAECKSSIVFVAHNAKFDKSFLVRDLKFHGLHEKFLQKVNEDFAFVDTLGLFKRLYPNLSCYKQAFLVKKFLKDVDILDNDKSNEFRNSHQLHTEMLQNTDNEQNSKQHFETHNALHDAILLQKLYNAKIEKIISAIIAKKFCMMKNNFLKRFSV